ncbi:DUF4259 domain-containing protein [Streptomyces radicis]|uniref:DUF4259 domain-containing protein n=1 Tax=Streptomyces radicis TaxID=1750517 RepID=A0A3A9WG85_9ACTN|nr:DUF4259 domain-containing protein [Streptomyces radicis]RKN11965.1 DUF4259 domain-containing protein [Streptomyces radicis]RKN25984.1 DUF4259 domain-containing protein [Streptomyces radicis]
MGRWGAGNFDEDTAADHLSLITGKLVDETAEAMAGDPVELEPDEYWGVAVPCNLELLHLIGTRGYVGVTLPSGDTVREWKKTYLAVWDEAIDGLAPTAEFRARRRESLVRTFDQLAALADSGG